MRGNISYVHGLPPAGVGFLVMPRHRAFLGEAEKADQHFPSCTFCVDKTGRQEWGLSQSSSSS